MLTTSSRFSFSVLFILAIFISQACFAAQSGIPQPLTDEQKLEQVKEYFQSEYQEEDYFRTDRLLLIATKHLEREAKAPAIATVITANEIRNMGARNLLDILRRVPGIGVNIASAPPVVRSVAVRGIKTLYSEKILVMMDGHRLNDIGNATAILDYGDLSVENIKRVEVIRGPGSALYGAGAFLGVVNIVTKEADDINGLQVTAGGGRFDTEHYNVLFGHPGEKIKVSGYLDYLNTDGPSSFIGQDAIGNSGDTLNWQEKAELGFNISYNDFTLRGLYHTNENGPYIGVAGALNDDSVLRYGNGGYLDLSFRKAFANNINITARAYGDYFKIDNYFEILPEGFPGFPEGMIGHPQTKERILGSEVSLDYGISDHLLTFGVMYENERLYDVRHETNYNPLEVVPTPLEPPGPVQDVSDWANFNEDSTRGVWAVYLQDVWSLSETASLTAGVRNDRYSDIGGSINPRLGFVWEFLENMSLKLLYGSAFRAPSFTELHQKNNPSNVGNPDLKPEEIKTYEVGLEKRFIINDSFWTFRVNYFHNSIDDLIIIDTTSVPPQDINGGSAKVDGVEAELLFDFSRDLYGYLNYSYQDPRDGETDKRLPDVPSSRANAGINFVPWRYLNANINVSWVGDRPRAEGDPRGALSSNTLVDLTLIAKNFYKKLEVRGSVYNLFDEDYRDPCPDLSVPDDYPTNERMFILELRYLFKK